ncbi:MAG: acyl-CoA thioesterase [Ignavibacteria bacterium]|nr:acyl-CoA thioesterase [Ignavibacteria bacterium]
MITNKTTIRVRYADTDKMQFVYNGKYLEYFEVGRAELLRAYGLPYSQIEKQGYQLPLIEAGLKYYKPATYDDIIEIEASYSNLLSAKLKIEYKIRILGSEEIIVEGFTEHIFMNAETKKAVRPPKFYIDSLLPYFKKN